MTGRRIAKKAKMAPANKKAKAPAGAAAAPADDGVVETDRFVFFWHAPAAFAQWTRVEFEVDGERYDCAEQFMMAEKAKLFGDEEIRAEILQLVYDPKAAKALGRKVRDFDDAVWQAQCEEIVVRGNLAKFRQNPALKERLMATDGKTLVEASPRDRIWGIGLSATNPKARNPALWRGQNKLGKALMTVRDILAAEALVPK